MNYAKLFRFLANTALLGGIAGGAWWIYNGLVLWGISAIISGFFTAHLWGAGADIFDQMAHIRSQNAEILQRLGRMWAETHPEDQHRPYVAASVAAREDDRLYRKPRWGDDGPAWPSILAVRQPIATHNGINISPGLRGAWLAKQGSETSTFESAADLAAWLDTLPKTRN